jgi:hypothetical protein
VFRHIASRATSIAFSTGRFALGIPVGVVRGVLDHLGGHREDDSGSPLDDAAWREAAAQQAADTPAPRTATEASAESAKGGRQGPPKPGRTEDKGPEVVLSIDSPPEQVEPPIDVVGEALANEKPQPPQPEHVEEEVEVVYSSTSEDD